MPRRAGKGARAAPARVRQELSHVREGYPGLPGRRARRAQPVEVPGGGHWWRRLLAFAGPGYLVAAGYMDPGNWATDVAGGARLGYLLLSLILLSSLMAMLLQALSARLGIASGLDLRLLADFAFG